MSSTTYICLQKTGPKYDRNFAHIKSFNRKFEARLKAKNPLAAAIATGQIAVKAIKTPLGKMYEHITGILTVTMLAIMIVMAPDPTETEKRILSKYRGKVNNDKFGIYGLRHLFRRH